jgi:hypothetical protein
VYGEADAAVGKSKDETASRELVRKLTPRPSFFEFLNISTPIHSLILSQLNNRDYSLIDNVFVLLRESLS